MVLCRGRAQRRTERVAQGGGYRVLLVREQALHVLDRVAFQLLGAPRLQAELGLSSYGAKGVKVLIHAQRVVVLRRHVDARGAMQDLRHPRDPGAPRGPEARPARRPAGADAQQPCSAAKS